MKRRRTLTGQAGNAMVTSDVGAGAAGAGGRRDDDTSPAPATWDAAAVKPLHADNWESGIRWQDSDDSSASGSDTSGEEEEEDDNDSDGAPVARGTRGRSGSDSDGDGGRSGGGRGTRRGANGGDKGHTGLNGSSGGGKWRRSRSGGGSGGTDGRAASRPLRKKQNQRHAWRAGAQLPAPLPLVWQQNGHVRLRTRINAELASGQWVDRIAWGGSQRKVRRGERGTVQ